MRSVRCESSYTLAAVNLRRNYSRFAVPVCSRIIWRRPPEAPLVRIVSIRRRKFAIVPFGVLCARKTPSDNRTGIKITCFGTRLTSRVQNVSVPRLSKNFFLFATSLLCSFKTKKERVRCVENCRQQLFLLVKRVHRFHPKCEIRAVTSLRRRHLQIFNEVKTFMAKNIRIA